MSWILLLASSVLYDRCMAREMDSKTRVALGTAAQTVREREEWLEEMRAERDQAIYAASLDGYTLGEIAQATELAKSTVALVVKMETLRRSIPA